MTEGFTNEQATIIGLNADLIDAHDDLRRILRALDLFDGARPISAHDVVMTVILPKLAAYRRLVSPLRRVLDDRAAGRSPLYTDMQELRAALAAVDAVEGPAHD